MQQNPTRVKIRQIVEDMHRDGLYSPHLAKLKTLIAIDDYWEDRRPNIVDSEAPTPPTGFRALTYLQIPAKPVSQPPLSGNQWPPAAKAIVALLSLLGAVREFYFTYKGWK